MGGNPIILAGLGSLPGVTAQVGKGPAKEEAPASSGSATPPVIEPPALQCSEVVDCTALPWTVTQFRTTAQQRITSMNARIGAKQQQIAQARQRLHHHQAGIVQQARSQIQSYQGQIAIFRLVIWLANRELGTPQPISTLMSSLNSVGGGASVRNEWRAQIAMILVSELEDPEAAAALESIIGNGNDWRSQTGIERDRRALELIYSRILTSGPANGPRVPRDELSLLIGENRLRLAVIAKNQGRDTDFNTLLAEARTYASRLATLSNVATTSPADLLDGKQPYIRNSIETLGDNNHAALRHEFAWANVVMAQIISLEGEAITSDSQRLTSLQQAESYLRNTSVLPGFQQLEARRALAENLIQQGHTLNNLGRSYTDEFGEALCILDSITNFYSDYANHPGVTVPRWPVNINVSARTSRASLLQNLVGELEMTTQPAILCLLTDELTTQELQELQQGCCEDRVLRIQIRLLESLAQEFGDFSNPTPTSILGTTYQYDTNPPFSVLNDQERMNIRYALGENLALRGFFTLALGDDETALMSAAATHLNAVIAAPATQVTPLTKAMARLWLAKIKLAEVGEEHTFERNNELLDEAQQLITAALGANRLRGNLLRSAHEVNFQINLGRLESAMRQGESYSPATITQLEDAAFAIFSSEHATDELVERALRDLMEAYSVRKANHQRIVLIGNVLLGRNFEAPDSADTSLTRLVTALTNLRTRLNSSSQLELSPEFRTLLYLKLAEAVSWTGPDFLDDADAILDELASSLPAEIAPVTGERYNRTLYLLLRAELQMRLNESADPIMDPTLVQTVVESREVDLITRLTFAQVEGLQYGGRSDYPTLIQLLRDMLSTERLQQIETLYGDNRQKSYLQYRFRLWLELGRVLSWDQQYAEAQTELTALLADSDLATLTTTDPALGDVISTMARLNLGNILRYDWDGRDLAESRINYQTIISSHRNLDQVTNPDLLVAIAEAHLGLAEIDMMPGDNRDLEAATEHFLQVQQIANRLTDDPDKHHELLARTFLGLANLSRNGSGWLQNDLEQVAQYINSAREHLRQITDPPDGLADAIGEIYDDPNINSRISPEITFNLTTFSGGDRAETQLNIGFHSPLDLSLSDTNLSWLHATGRLQTDFGPDGNIYSFYGGLRAMLHSSLTLNTEFRFYTWVDPGATMQFFRHQDLNLGLDYWSQGIDLGETGSQLAISLGGEVRLNYPNNDDVTRGSDPSDYNTYSGYGALNFLFPQTPVMERVSLGFQCGSYPFAFTGEARRMNSCAFGPSLALEATDWLSFNGNFMGLAYQTTDDDPNTENPWQMGWQGGLGIDFNLHRHFRFGGNLWHQHTEDLPITTVTGNAAITF